MRGVTASLQNRYANLGSILQAVAVGEAKAGYVLASRARWMAAENFPEQLRFVQPKPPVDQFPVCIAMRRGQTELKNQIDTRLTALRTTGRLEQVFSRWHLPKEASSIHGGSPQ